MSKTPAASSRKPAPKAKTTNARGQTPGASSTKAPATGAMGLAKKSKKAAA